MTTVKPRKTNIHLVLLIAVLASLALLLNGCACSSDDKSEESAENVGGDESGGEATDEEGGDDEEAAEDEELAEDEGSEEDEWDEEWEEEDELGNEEDKKDDKSDIDILAEACDGGDGRKCNNLGFRYDRGIGVAVDKPKALDLYKKACDLKDNVGCNNAGIFLEQGQAGPKDNDAAVPYYVKSCELDNPYGCTNSGRMHWHARGVDKDEEKALGFYRKGCDGYVANSCNAWAWHRCYDQKNCDEESEKAARRAVRMAPRTGYVLDTLAYVLCQRDNKKESNEYYGKACDAGFKDDCGIKCKKGAERKAKDVTFVVNSSRRGRKVRSLKNVRGKVRGGKIRTLGGGSKGRKGGRKGTKRRRGGSVRTLN